MAEQTAIDLVLSRLDKVRKQAGQHWMACCPAHEDRNPSLSITVGRSQPVLLNCHAGCHVEDVVAALGLTWAELCEGIDADKPVVVATYVYVDEFGEPLFYSERLEPKRFRQYRIIRGRKVWELGDVRRVLYHLPQLVMGVGDGKTVYVVEGEKDVHAIERAGGVATCNPMGAGRNKWRDEYNTHLAGAHVVIVADLDTEAVKFAGQRHAVEVAASLKGTAASVEIVQAASGKDSSDHLAAGHKLADFVPFVPPWAEPAEQWRGDGEQDQAGAPALPGPEPSAITPEEFWQQRDVLTRLHDYAQANRAGPWAVLGATLARVTAAITPAVMLPPLTGGRASLNMFVALVGTPGAGKGVAERTAEGFLGRGVEVTTAGVGSGEGIGHLYVRLAKGKGGELEQGPIRCYLVRIPEIETMAALQARRGATLLAELRKAFMGEELAFQYAAREKRVKVPAHTYRLSIVAGVQPTRAGVLLDDVDGGTPQRFLWLPVNDPTAPEECPAAPRGLSWGMPPMSEIGDHDGELELRVSDTARTLIDADRLARLRGGEVEFAAHAALTRLKTAAALAWLSRPSEVHLDGVTDDDWDLAGVVMAMSDRTRQHVIDAAARERSQANEQRGHADAVRAAIVADEASRRGVERACKAAMRVLNAAGGEWVGRGRIKQGMTKLHRPYLSEALEVLVKRGEAEGELTERDADGYGGTGERYRSRS